MYWYCNGICLNLFTFHYTTSLQVLFQNEKRTHNTCILAPPLTRENEYFTSNHRQISSCYRTDQNSIVCTEKFYGKYSNHWVPRKNSLMRTFCNSFLWSVILNNFMYLRILWGQIRSTTRMYHISFVFTGYWLVTGTSTSDKRREILWIMFSHLEFLDSADGWQKYLHPMRIYKRKQICKPAWTENKRNGHWH